MAASSPVARGPMPASGTEGNSIPAGPAVPCQTEVPQVPAPADFDRPLRASGNVSVTATGHHRQGNPARKDSRDPVTPDSNQATTATQGPTGKHRQVMARSAVRGATRLQRRVLTGMAPHRATGAPHRTTDPTDRAIRRRARAFPLRDRTRRRASPAEVRDSPAERPAETPIPQGANRVPPAVVRAEAADTGGNLPICQLRDRGE
jgi:hypothetical protein